MHGPIPDVFSTLTYIENVYSDDFLWKLVVAGLYIATYAKLKETYTYKYCYHFL